MKLPKIVSEEITGDPLVSPDWSSIILATVHTQLVADKIKMSHLKTLVSGKPKALLGDMG